MDTNKPVQQTQPQMLDRVTLFDELRSAVGRAEDLLKATRQNRDPSCAEARQNLETMVRAARIELACYYAPRTDTCGTTGEAKIFDHFKAGADK